MKIVLVGAGNLATQLGRSLAGHGYDIAQIYSRTEASAETLGAVLQVPFVTSVGEICTDADLYIVAVKDSALPELIPQLVNGREHALFVHTAGSLPMDIWKHHALRYGVFYPMQTFSKQRQVEFDSIPIFIEAQNEADCRRLKNWLPFCRRRFMMPTLHSGGPYICRLSLPAILPTTCIPFVSICWLKPGFRLTRCCH